MSVPFSELKYDSLSDVYFIKDQKFDYSDGEEIEKYILNVLRKSKDTTIFSEELNDKIKDWPTYYHFSSLRQNICRPIQIDKTHDVLEIGSGCGAITRYLAEAARSVTCIEGSYYRALATRARCKDLNNLTVINANFNDLEIEQKYDIITLIGVFEYTAKYSTKDEPFKTALLDYKALLKPNGRIIMAIENKLGLKYLMGQAEDHTGVKYYGIEDKYRSKEVRTFGKVEIEELAKKAGLNTRFYFPFPDYKMPKVILSTTIFEFPNINIYDLIALCKPYDYSTHLGGNFDYCLALKSLLENGLLPDCSNSFLIELATSEFNIGNCLSYHFSTERKTGYNTVTSICKQDQQLKVYKRLLPNQIMPIENLILHKIKADSCYIFGRNLLVLMVSSIKKDDFKQFENYVKLWYKFLQSNTSLNQLPPFFIDCLPQNLLLDNSGKIHYIDAEWEWDNMISVEYVFVRFINSIYVYGKSQKQFSKRYGHTPMQIMRRLCSILNISDIKDFKALTAKEAGFYKLLTNYPHKFDLEKSNASKLFIRLTQLRKRLFYLKSTSHLFLL